MQINSLYQNLIEKVRKNQDPTDEFNLLLSFTEIKEVILDISDNESLYLIETMFSNIGLFEKTIELNRYAQNINSKNQNTTIDKLTDEINFIISHNITSLDYLYKHPRINLSDQEISNLIYEWNNYLEKNQNLITIFLDFELDCQTIFIIAVLIWGFFYSGLAIAIPSLFPTILCYSEALIIGLGSSTVLGSIGLIKEFVQFLFDNFPFLAIYLDNEGLEAAMASLICLLVTGVFLYLYESYELIMFIGCGMGFITPPLILFFICKLFIPSS
jgi:hypothetical protein